MAQKYILGQQAQRRKRSVRYVVSITVLLLILSVLQVSFFGRFRLFGATPDLMIIGVLCIGFFTGQYTGAVCGIGAGFLIDALGSTGVTILPVCYLLVGYLVGIYAKRTTNQGFVQYLIYLAITLLFRAAITVLYACLGYESLNLPLVLLYAVLPELLVTALAGLALYFPMRLFCGLLEKSGKRR